MDPMQQIKAAVAAVGLRKLVPMRQLVAQERAVTDTPRALPELPLHMAAVVVVEHVWLTVVVLQDQAAEVLAA
jgi:hypothetical protein